MRRHLVNGAVAALLIVALSACASGGGAPFTASYPAATADGNPVPISLVDQTGLVTAMVAAPDAAAGAAVEAVPGSANALRVSWQGGACDDRSTLVLNAMGGGRYELAIHNHPPITAGFDCDASTVARVIEITLSQPLAPEQLSLSLQYP